MSQPGVPALGPMSLITRARAFTPGPLQQRSMAVRSVGPVQIWRDPVGPMFLYQSANWGGAAWYLEVYLRATSAKAMARLYDVTAAAAVANSVVTDDNAPDGLATALRLRSVALTLVDAHEYRVQFGVQDGGAGGYQGAKLIAIGTPITHAFVNPKADLGDATITRPSDWNAAHLGSLLEDQIALIALSAEVTF